MKQLLKAIALSASFLVVASAMAQTDPSIMLTPPKPYRTSGEDGRPTFWDAEVSASAFYTGSEANISGADVDLSIFDIAGRIRLDPASSYNPTIGFSYTHFDIGTADAALPDRLIDAQAAFGGMFPADTFGQWQAGYTLGIGYAGTSLFNDDRAWYLTANIFAMKAIDKDTRWLVGINYDGNRAFLPDAPLPAVTYFSRLSETVTYGLGFPYSTLTWTPNDEWLIEVKSALFFSFTGKATYKITPDYQLYAAYLRRTDAFTLPNTIDNRRMMFSQQKLELGFVDNSFPSMAINYAVGYAFGQEFDFGYDISDPTGVRDLDSSFYIRVGLDIGF